MNKYLAKIVYKIVSLDGGNLEQFDEQLCFIVARDYQEAFFKARMMGVKNEDAVDHESGKNIHWKFIDVPYLKEIESMEDGVELYSCITEREKEDSFERFVKARASQLQQHIEQQLIPA
jgi:hypothetical protein